MNYDTLPVVFGEHRPMPNSDGYGEGRYDADGFVYRAGRRHHHWSIQIERSRAWPARITDLCGVQRLSLRCAKLVDDAWKAIQTKLQALRAAGITMVNHRPPETPINATSIAYTIEDPHLGHSFFQGTRAPITDLVSAIAASVHLEHGADVHRLDQRHRTLMFRWAKVRAVLDAALRYRIGTPTEPCVYVLTVCGVPHVYHASFHGGDRALVLERVGDLAVAVQHIEVGPS